MFSYIVEPFGYFLHAVCTGSTHKVRLFLLMCSINVFSYIVEPLGYLLDAVCTGNTDTVRLLLLMCSTRPWTS